MPSTDETPPVFSALVVSPNLDIGMATPIDDAEIGGASASWSANNIEGG
jgi:hypothetical protein